MKKISHRSKLIIILILAVVLIMATTIVWLSLKSNRCQDIIGDGYYIGTDPQPVVIGNTCDF